MFCKKNTQDIYLYVILYDFDETFRYKRVDPVPLRQTK